MGRSILTIVMLLLSGLQIGCGDKSSFSASVWDPFGLTWRLDPHAEPVRIGLACDYGGIFDVQTWGQKAPWDDLVHELSQHLGRPVVVENLKPFQIGFHLTDETGRLQFALVSAEDYLAMVEEQPVGPVVALSQARHRQGVVVARANSEITETSDLKGERFAFGPSDDPVLHDATVAYLAEAGVPTSDLKTLIPDQLQFHISSREAAKEVAYGLGTNAGVIEAEEFDAYPASGGRWIPFAETFSKDQFRELGRTPATRIDTIGEGPFVAGKRTDRELVDQVRSFLLAAAQENPRVVRSLGFARFRPAPANPADEIARLAAAESP